MRVLALDYGSARCGTAVSDASGTIATPLEEIARPGTRRGLTRVVELAGELGAEVIVVGLPLSMSGGDSAQTTETREFASRLAERVAVPVVLHDERLTTRMAQRSAGTGSERARAGEDSRAAAHLLQDWLATRQRETAPDGAGEVGSPPHRAPADR